MSDQQYPNLTELNSQLLSGSAALEKNEIEDLLVNVKNELNQVVENRQLEDSTNWVIWKSIFNGLLSSGLANKFMEEMNKDIFFSFGKYLVSSLNKQDEKIISIIHSYLNLFRYSPFLQKLMMKEDGMSSSII